MDMMTRIAALTADCIKALWPDAEGLPAAEEIRGLLAVPPDPALGDYAFPCFRLAKPLRSAPPKIAEAICGAWQAADTASVQPVNGYMNFFLNRANFAAEIMAELSEKGDRFGSSDEGSGKTVCLDYSSINIAKRFHIGHLSTTMIGHSLKRIFEFLGYKTVGINHLGDWGTQFGKMVCAYKKWGNKEDVEKRGIDAMTELYVRFHQEAEKDPALEDEGRAWFKKIEDNDPEAMEIFRWFKEVTLKDAAKVYDKLGVSFDSYAGESFYNDKMEPVVRMLKEKGLLVESQGAQVVDLEEDNMPPCLILKSDGATIYATRDLAAAIYRRRGLPAGPALPAGVPRAGEDGLSLGEELRPRRLRHDQLRGRGPLHPQGQRRASGGPAGPGGREGAGHHRGKIPGPPEQGGGRPPGGHRRGDLHRPVQQPDQGYRLPLGTRPEL